jgi:tRNA pseudouridine55 synthase
MGDTTIASDFAASNHSKARLIMAFIASVMFCRNSRCSLLQRADPWNGVHSFSPTVLKIRREREQSTVFFSVPLLSNKFHRFSKHSDGRDHPRFHTLYSSSTASEQEIRQQNDNETSQHDLSIQNSPTSTQGSSTNTTTEEIVPLYRAQGLLAVHKPFNWTSQDVVSYLRGILERDARNRGANPTPIRSRRNKSRKIKVGHGGTLDPLATGVLVIGVGHGTKQLNDYLSGSKAYRATGQLGMETSTLDLDPTGTVVKEASWEHITEESLRETLPKFLGTIDQVPPLYSAKRVNGKKLYEVARSGKVDDDLVIEAKQVEIYNLELASVELPQFTIAMECGGGTFVRSLIRDVAYDLDSVATTTFLQRTKQGPFGLGDCLEKEDWTADKVYAEIEEWNLKLAQQVTGDS